MSKAHQLLGIERQELMCTTHGLSARGRFTVAGFLVLEGSQAVLQHRKSAEKYHHILNLRSRLLENGTLVRMAGNLEFTRDYEFGSPSTAAGVIQGGQANGWECWRNLDGMTLNAMLREKK